MIDVNIKREIIMDHYTNPRNKRAGDDTYEYKHMASDSCIDDIKVYIKFDNNKIVDVCFDGVGCTISTASTSIMSELINGLSIDEALKIISEYEKMIYEDDYNEGLLKEAIAFDTLSKQANRINCGLIGVKGMKEILEKRQNER